MKKYFLLGLFCGIAFASEKSLLNEEIFSEYRQGELVKLTPKEDHHINLKSPNKCGEGKTVEIVPDEMICRLSESGEQKITLGVCDDEKTFCKIEKHPIIVKGSAPSFWAKIKNLFKTKEREIPKDYGHTPAGFLTNDPNTAQKLAKTEGKLLLIDFFGIWCPPCNMLDEYVWDRSDIAEISKHFIKIRLDADSDISMEWKNHFQAKGYPTVVIADADLNEISRIVGYRPVEYVKKWMADSWKLKAQPIAGVANHSYRKISWLYEADRCEELRGISLKKNTRQSQLLLDLCSLRVIKAKKEKITFLKKLVSKYPTDFRMLYWLSDLLEYEEKAYVTQRYSMVMKIVSSYSEKSHEFEQWGYEWGDLYFGVAAIAEGLDKKSDAKQAYLKAAAFYGDMAKLSNLKIPRAANMGLAYAWRKAGENDKAAKLYEQLIGEYKNEFTFHNSYAWTLYNLKKYSEARIQADLAYQHSYGDNRLRAAVLVSKVYKELKMNDKAKALLQSTLSKTAIPQQDNVRTHVYIQRLRKELSTL